MQGLASRISPHTWLIVSRPYGPGFGQRCPIGRLPCADMTERTGDTFPRQFARTQRLTLGEPRNVIVSPDGLRVVFARSRAGDDAVNCLWVLDVASGEERLVADPLALLGVVDDDELPPEERARRERMREGAAGITSFATDEACTVAAFALAGRLFAAGLLS